MADRPVNYVNFNHAARFVNWLQNGQPTGAQTAATTERGAYTLDGAMSGVSFTRNAGATYGLPSENEWYKAAYHQPAAQGGDSYWFYPTGSNNPPTVATANAVGDISNPGVLGSLGMLLEASGKGALIDISKMPRPKGVDLLQWLTAYQGCGFVVTCRPARFKIVMDEFARSEISARASWTA